MVSGTTRTAKGSVETVALGKAEQTAARRAAESKATIPHIYLEADAEIAGPPPLGAGVVVACAAGLRETPRLNGAYRDGNLELHSRINIGVVVQSAGAAQAATIFDADSKSAGEVAAEIESLSSRAADGSITAPELSGATFTVDDLSGSGAALAHGVVSPGQAAILTVGAPSRDGVVRLGLACDHRVVGTAEAAAFLGRVSDALRRAAEG